MCECYMSVSEWQALEMWYSQVKTLQTGQVSSGGLDATAFTIHYDINQIRYGNMIVAEWCMGVWRMGYQHAIK